MATLMRGYRHSYTDAMARSKSSPVLEIERVQTGVRLEKRLLKVMKALAEYKEIGLGDLIEGIVLHAFEGKTPFSRDTLAKIAQFREIYGLDLDAAASHRMSERGKE